MTNEIAVEALRLHRALGEHPLAQPCQCWNCQASRGLKSAADEIERLTKDRDYHRDRYFAFLGEGARLAGMTSNEPLPCARPLSEWHEDDWPAVWWRFPVEEPAWIGGPNDSDWPGYHTHWTPHPSVPTLKPQGAPRDASSEKSCVERLSIIKQTPRQASIDDIEWLCEEVERLQAGILYEVENASLAPSARLRMRALTTSDTHKPEKPGYHCGKLKADCDDEFCPTHGHDIR